MTRVSTLDALLALCDRAGGPASCWLWNGSRFKDGYGQTRLFGGPSAHRAMWVAHHGGIPAGLCVLHHCDNPPCINPAHLFLGSIADNNADMVAKKRHSFGGRHFASRHPEMRRGELNSNAKLTAAQVAQIRASFKGQPGEKARIARAHGVCWNTIDNIVRNRNWRA